MDNSVLKIVYTIFVGVLLALFVGLGIQTFYPPPKQPEYPIELNVKEPGDEARQAQADFEKQVRDYQDENDSYNRTVAIVATSAAALLLGLSLLLEKKGPVLANGIMLGGLFTLLYSVTRGLASRDTQTTFISVSIALVLVMFLGYRRFILHGNKDPGSGAPPVN
ncbi:hypothetical protein [Arthrobacter cavernae]|uniref:Uncharacterized protein n=1 Tax=Arthrobacter cavernae TaxID=2817681 RepID=A0A939HE86_9MICC|nr:hypothetical protein [Arthrobacter cavernae]MBO1269259.1 hypothetical protein [Arthrobacter cavernae]